jgi:hypothetical protein
MLKKLVDSYMHDEWVNYKRDIGFHAAKEELLSYASIMFCEIGTHTPKNVFQDEDLEVNHPLSVMADVNGDFPDIYLDGDYSLELYGGDGACLLMVTTQSDFDITA